MPTRSTLLALILLALTSNLSAAELDDPAAMPGQIIVAGSNPGYLKYNGGSAAFLVGPDNPEDFLFQGELQEDGTRAGGKQEQMIDRMAKTGINAFHCQMFRMQRCNYKNEGDDSHSPFKNGDPAAGLNPAVLNQWDSWLGLFEQHGIIVHLEFYNDATDVERMGWTLDTDGSLHPDEHRWITGIVERFKHRKNIIWGIEESCNKLPRERTAHFKKIAEVIASVDNFHHPIVQSFVVPNDPEGDFPEGGVTSDDYVGDPHIRLVTWLHLVPHGKDYQKQHREYLSYALRDQDRFVVLKNETFHHPRRGASSRRYMWSCAMTGMHALEAYHHADTTAIETLEDDGRIREFMEQTDFYRMRSADQLAAGSTQWVLANPGKSYIGYTYEYRDGMGFQELPAGTYDLLWFDTISGREVRQTKVKVTAGKVTWPKPAGLSDEIALYLTLP